MVLEETCKVLLFCSKRACWLVSCLAAATTSEADSLFPTEDLRIMVLMESMGRHRQTFSLRARAESSGEERRSRKEGREPRVITTEQGRSRRKSWLLWFNKRCHNFKNVAKAT